MSEFLSQPASWEVTKSSYRNRVQIIINNLSLYLAVLHTYNLICSSKMVINLPQVNEKGVLEGCT